MAQATTYKFSEFLILIGQENSPESFGDPCGLTSRGFQRTANMNDTNIPDCADPDAPTWLGRDVISYQASLSGAGVVASESFGTWEGWWESGDYRNCRIELDTHAWEGHFRISEFNITGERGQRVNMNITLVSDGVITKVAP